MLPIPKADGPFGDGVDDIAKKWRSSRGIERALSLLDGSINHFVVRSKGSLALQFDEDIQIVAHLVEATATVNRPQEARRVARIVRSCVDLQPDMAALANPDTMSVEAAQTILDRWESFKRSQVRCVTLCASERLKDRANCDGRRSVFERWQIRRQRKRLVIAARRALLDEPSSRRALL